jgi:hypothetical protein
MLINYFKNNFLRSNIYLHKISKQFSEAIKPESAKSELKILTIEDCLKDVEPKVK